MLKASGTHDSTIPKRQEKSPVMVTDLNALTTLLQARGPEEAAVLGHGKADGTDIHQEYWPPKTGTPANTRYSKHVTTIDLHNPKTEKPS